MNKNYIEKSKKKKDKSTNKMTKYITKQSNTKQSVPVAQW